MPAFQAIAYGFATTFKMRELAHCFAGARLRLAKTQIMASYDETRVAVAFDFGAIVFINVSAEERARVIGGVLARVATEEPHPPLEEDFIVEVRPDATGEVRFDRVIVPELSPPIVDVVTILLAQSVAIDYYEEDLQEILHKLDRRTGRMAQTGRILGSTRDLVRFVGSALDTKNQIIAALALLDKPAVTWEAEALDRLYRDLRAMLEIDERFRALEYKLRTIQDSLEVLLDLANHRRSLFLEATIVVLIILELVLGVLRA